MTEEQLEESLTNLLGEFKESNVFGKPILRIRTYKEEDLITIEKGLVITLVDNTEFQLTIQKTN